MKLKTTLFITLFLQLIFAQEINLEGKWKAVNKKFNYEVIYKIKKVDNYFEGLALSFESQDGKYKFSEDDNLKLLQDFKFSGSKKLTGFYLEPEDNTKFKAEIKITDKNTFELKVIEGDEVLTEKVSRIID